jgi:hypothetical protein
MIALAHASPGVTNVCLPAPWCTDNIASIARPCHQRRHQALGHRPRRAALHASYAICQEENPWSRVALSCEAAVLPG